MKFLKVASGFAVSVLDFLRGVSICEKKCEFLLVHRYGNQRWWYWFGLVLLALTAHVVLMDCGLDGLRRLDDCLFCLEKIFSNGFKRKAFLGI
jgi:hypothetical protein